MWTLCQMLSYCEFVVLMYVSHLENGILQLPSPILQLLDSSSSHSVYWALRKWYQCFVWVLNSPLFSACCAAMSLCLYLHSLQGEASLFKAECSLSPGYINRCLWECFMLCQFIEADILGVGPLHSGQKLLCDAGALCPVNSCGYSTVLFLPPIVKKMRIYN